MEREWRRDNNKKKMRKKMKMQHMRRKKNYRYRFLFGVISVKNQKTIPYDDKNSLSNFKQSHLKLMIVIRSFQAFASDFHILFHSIVVTHTNGKKLYVEGGSWRVHNFMFYYSLYMWDRCWQSFYIYPLYTYTFYTEHRTQTHSNAERENCDEFYRKSNKT